MRTWIARHPFLLLGVISIALYAVLARVGPLELLLRVLIIPAYVMSLLVTVLLVRLGGASQLPAAAGIALLVLKLVAALLPYVAADALLSRMRRRRKLPVTAAT